MAKIDMQSIPKRSMISCVSKFKIFSKDKIFIHNFEKMQIKR